MALIRKDSAGKLARVLVKSGKQLREKGRVIFTSDNLLDSVSAMGRPEVEKLAAQVAGERKPPQISDLKVQLEPPQKGLAGAQPSALVTWKTDAPATSQVAFGEGASLDQRIILDSRLTTEHQVRVYFLRPGKQYGFKAMSADKWGNRAEIGAK